MRCWKNEIDQALKPAKSVIEEALTPEIRRGLAVAGMAFAWAGIVGDKLARRTAPEKIEKTVLTVVASNGAFAQEISMRGGSIAREIMERWGIEVTSVKVRVGRLPGKKGQKRTGRRQKEKIKVPEKALQASRSEIDRTVGREDAEEALARLMALYRTRFGSRDGESR
ncbi:MAG: DUF721 domain-containing protein [Thermovirgaceae bacterium]